jgi:hypothetical protein
MFAVTRSRLGNRLDAFANMLFNVVVHSIRLAPLSQSSPWIAKWKHD